MKKIYYFIILSALILSGCSSSEDPPPPRPRPHVPSTAHTVLIYLGVDNNFAQEARQKIDMLKSGWRDSYDGNLLFYADGGGRAGTGSPVLVDIYHNGIEVVADTVATYSMENSASVAVFTRVLRDVEEGWPAQKRGLVVLSHASGWLPQGGLVNPSRQSRSVIHDGGSDSELELWDFASAISAALPGKKLDYAIFDACLMAGVEVVYELKDVIGKVVVSPAELLSPGFVYTSMMSHLMKATPDVEAVAREFFEYFSNHPNGGLWRSATISVIETSKIEAVADYIVANNLLDGVDGESATVLSAVQQFRPGTHKLYLDFYDYMKAIGGGEDTQLQSLIDACITYKAHTPGYYSAVNGLLNIISAYSGMTIYVPQTRYPWLNSHYKRLKWWEKVNTYIPTNQ